MLALIFGLAYFVGTSGASFPAQNSAPLAASQSSYTATSSSNFGVIRVGDTESYPHTTPYNETHAIVSRLEQLLPDSCPHLCDIEQISLDRSSWWHCTGNVTSCYSRLNHDLHDNLSSKECSGEGCFDITLPGHIASLKGLAERIMSVDDCTEASKISQCTFKFTEPMELLANIVIQKSRYCRFDAYMYDNLTRLVKNAIKQYRDCPEHLNKSTSESELLLNVRTVTRPVDLKKSKAVMTPVKIQTTGKVVAKSVNFQTNKTVQAQKVSVSKDVSVTKNTVSKSVQK